MKQLLLFLFIVSGSTTLFAQEQSTRAEDYRFNFESFAIPFKENGKYGLKTPSGKVTKIPVYDTIFPAGGHAFAGMNKEIFRIDTKGERIGKEVWRSIVIADGHLSGLKLDGTRVILPEFYRIPFIEYANLQAIQDSIRKLDEKPNSGLVKIQVMKTYPDVDIVETAYNEVLIRTSKGNAVFSDVSRVDDATGDFIIISKTDGSAVIFDPYTLKTLKTLNNVTVTDVYALNGKYYFVVVSTETKRLQLTDGDLKLLSEQIIRHANFFQHYCILETDEQCLVYDLNTGKTTTFGYANTSIVFKDFWYLESRNEKTVFTTDLKPLKMNPVLHFIKPVTSNVYLIPTYEDSIKNKNANQFRPKHQLESQEYFRNTVTAQARFVDLTGKELLTIPGSLYWIDLNARIAIVTTNANTKMYVRVNASSTAYDVLNYDYMIPFGENWLVQANGNYALVDQQLKELQAIKATDLRVDAKDGNVMLVEVLNGEKREYLTYTGKLMNFEGGRVKAIRTDVRDFPHHWFYVQTKSTKQVYHIDGTLIGTFDNADFIEVTATGMLICKTTVGKKSSVNYYGKDKQLISSF